MRCPQPLHHITRVKDGTAWEKEVPANLTANNLRHADAAVWFRLSVALQGQRWGSQRGASPGAPNSLVPPLIMYDLLFSPSLIPIPFQKVAVVRLKVAYRQGATEEKPQQEKKERIPTIRDEGERSRESVRLAWKRSVTEENDSFFFFISSDASRM